MRNEHHLRICVIFKLVIEPAGAAGAGEYCIYAVSYIADRVNEWKLNTDRFRVVRIIRLLTNLTRRLTLYGFIPR